MMKKISIDTPIIFSDGSKVYDKLSLSYIKHKKGYFILAPSGTGKTYYINNQLKNDWIDGDLLWLVTGADYSSDEWEDNFEDVMDINGRSDVITAQAKKLGFWVLGSSNVFVKPDAIVIPPWETHISYIKKRENTNYDGGATSSNAEDVKEHIDWIIRTWGEEVPVFDSIIEATEYIANLYNTDFPSDEL